MKHVLTCASHETEYCFRKDSVLLEKTCASVHQSVMLKGLVIPKHSVLSLHKSSHHELLMANRLLKAASSFFNPLVHPIIPDEIPCVDLTQISLQTS